MCGGDRGIKLMQRNLTAKWLSATLSCQPSFCLTFFSQVYPWEQHWPLRAGSWNWAIDIQLPCASGKSWWGLPLCEWISPARESHNCLQRHPDLWFYLLHPSFLSLSSSFPYQYFVGQYLQHTLCFLILGLILLGENSVWDTTILIKYFLLRSGLKHLQDQNLRKTLSGF